MTPAPVCWWCDEPLGRRGDRDGPGGARYHRACLAADTAERSHETERARLDRERRRPPAKLAPPRAKSLADVGPLFAHTKTGHPFSMT